MIILTGTSDTLQVVLGGSVTTNELQVVTSWRDITTTTFTPGRTATLTNGATPVTAVSSPSSSNQILIDFISVYNNDTVSQTVAIQFYDGTNTWILCEEALTSGQTLQYTSEAGFEISFAVSSGGGGMTNPMTTAGDIIRGGTGGTPTRVAIGTTGQVLTVVGGEPAWANAGSGIWTDDGTYVYYNGGENVGIGTTTPGYPLEVSGTIAAHGYLQADYGTGTGNYCYLGGNYLGFYGEYVIESFGGGTLQDYSDPNGDGHTRLHVGYNAGYNPSGDMAFWSGGAMVANFSSSASTLSGYGLKLYDSTGSVGGAGVSSVNWDSRQLYASDGSLNLNWNTSGTVILSGTIQTSLDVAYNFGAESAVSASALTALNLVSQLKINVAGTDYYIPCATSAQ